MSTKRVMITSKTTRTLVRAVVPLRTNLRTPAGKLEATLKLGVVFSCPREELKDVEEAVAEALGLDPLTVQWYRSGQPRKNVVPVERTRMGAGDPHVGEGEPSGLGESPDQEEPIWDDTESPEPEAP